MESDDKVLSKALDSRTSSSAISTPEKDVKMDYHMRAHCSHDFLKSYSKKELVHASLEQETYQAVSSKCKASVGLSKSTTICKNIELKKQSLNNHVSKKQPRKCDHPVRLSITEFSVDCTSSLTCKNSACKAILSTEDSFCRRCSCCICHLYDDNKDPSLWLFCSSDSGVGDWCGLSCHIECALQRKKVGVVDLGQFMQLDGSYCCASCGKVSGIIGCWKKQLMVAKDARRVDILCYRVSLCHRLLEGTSRFKELHKFVEDTMMMLEAEVGPVNGVSARMARGIVGRLSVASDVHNLLSSAIEKAEEWLNCASLSDPKHRDSLPAACKFQFEEITSSSFIIELKEPWSTAPASIKGYKLWYCNSRDQTYHKDPVIIPRSQKRILISNLQPCTEYSFRIISFTEKGDLGHSIFNCFTKSVEIINKQIEQTGIDGCSSNKKRVSRKPNAESSGFMVRKLGKILRLAWAQEEGCFHEFYVDDVEEEFDVNGSDKPDKSKEDQLKPSAARQLDLNVISVPDLNADLTPTESSPEDNGYASEKNDLAASNGSGNGAACDVDSSLIGGSPHRLSHSSSQLDNNYEYCIKVIRWLECLGHIEKDFRLKFLTWFSLSSTEQERCVVITFIRTLIEEPGSLAGQLLDSFLEIVNCKRPRHGFCSKLWH
ncbi:VIN3-like protein 1 [Apostasia shenzhenica]|uniref:VIN3-like protein 1 n=1 Tax=Apostasia shenzhenica TaxID=1088818 RepID=A0A2I0BBX7_9ASPA|nr:VIN3-like protein 1 [Apostasia shenzhenica]